MRCNAWPRVLPLIRPQAAAAAIPLLSSVLAQRCCLQAHSEDTHMAEFEDCSLRNAECHRVDTACQPSSCKRPQMNIVLHEPPSFCCQVRMALAVWWMRCGTAVLVLPPRENSCVSQVVPFSCAAGEAGTGNVVEAVRHCRAVMGAIKQLQTLDDDEIYVYAKVSSCPCGFWLCLDCLRLLQ